MFDKTTTNASKLYTTAAHEGEMHAKESKTRKPGDSELSKTLTQLFPPGFFF